jgi:hypothetical protein
MNELHCPCCGGGIDPEQWREMRQWLKLMDIDFSFDGTVDTKGAARLLGKAIQTLENWRSMGSHMGPNYIKDAHGRIRYHIDDITSFREGYDRGDYALGIKLG